MGYRSSRVQSADLSVLDASGIGDDAPIIWQPVDDSAPFCSSVRVRKESGALEMVKDGTFICPPDAPAKAAP
jgi:hypothetical protein